MEPYLTGHCLYGLYGGYYNSNYRERRYRIYKEFTTPDRNEVYAIIYLRFTGKIWDVGEGEYVSCPCGGSGLKLCFKHVKIWFGSYLEYIGKPYENTTSEGITRDEWMVFVVPLPKNTTEELRIIVDVAIYGSGGSAPRAITYIDAVRIISRN